MKREPLDHSSVLNFAGKYLARGPDAPGTDYAEAWRFPIVDGYRSNTAEPVNLVTFVWRATAIDDRRPISVVGTFDNLWDATPLEPVLFDGQPTLYRAATVLISKGQVHLYKFMVDGQSAPDPINPQRTVLDNGVEWSRFFTDLCAVPVSFESWELAILARLTNEILPFTGDDAQRFMDLYYFNADKRAREDTFHQAFRLEQPIGAANFIDKLVAREERHRLTDYKICLKLIAEVLRARFPGLAPADVSKDAYQDLYGQMATDKVDGWDTGRYGSAKFFLQLLRRHTYTGAFSHPKYGGNAGAAGWAWLEHRFRGPKGESCFNWERAIEPPLGASADYAA